MLFALGAASSVIDALQSLTSSSKASSLQSAGPTQTTTSSFEVTGGATSSGSAACSSPNCGGSSISPQTLSALIAAQSQSGATSPTSQSPEAALKDLFSLIDTNGDGRISKQEFENALGAGGTNLAAADDVFNKLDTNGDGTVSLGELTSALRGGGHHHGHGHAHAEGAGQAGNSSGAGGDATNPLLQALAGASSTSATNADGSTTTTITYADGSKVSLTTPAASTTSTSSSPTSSATSSYNFIEQLIQREAQTLAASSSAAVSVSA